MAKRIVETYTKQDIQDQYHKYSLLTDGERWSVICESGYNEDDLEFAWEVNGVLTGYKDGNPNREIREPFTEETARAEFEKWRA